MKVMVNSLTPHLIPTLTSSLTHCLLGHRVSIIAAMVDTKHDKCEQRLQNEWHVGSSIQEQWVQSCTPSLLPPAWRLLWDQEAEEWVVDDAPAAVPAHHAQLMARLLEATKAEEMDAVLQGLGCNTNIVGRGADLLNALSRYAVVTVGAAAAKHWHVQPADGQSLPMHAQVLCGFCKETPHQPNILKSAIAVCRGSHGRALQLPEARAQCLFQGVERPTGCFCQNDR